MSNSAWFILHLQVSSKLIWDIMVRMKLIVLLPFVHSTSIIYTVTKASSLTNHLPPLLPVLIIPYRWHSHLSAQYTDGLYGRRFHLVIQLLSLQSNMLQRWLSTAQRMQIMILIWGRSLFMTIITRITLRLFKTWLVMMYVPTLPTLHLSVPMSLTQQGSHGLLYLHRQITP